MIYYDFSTFDEDESFKLFTAEEARLLSASIEIGLKWWNFKEAITNPSEELMLKFGNLGDILRTIENTAQEQKHSVTASKLKDNRLQQVLEACLTKLGYTVEPALEPFKGDGEREYYKVSW